MLRTLLTRGLLLCIARWDFVILVGVVLGWYSYVALLLLFMGCFGTLLTC